LTTRVVASARTARYFTRMRERKHNLVVRIDGDELAKLHRLADDRDEMISQMVRRWANDAYAARFGAEAPPTPKLKHRSQ
jgi:hypothetical protein